MIININNPPLHAVEISRQGENEFREIVIDVSSWLAEWPDGKISVIYSRPDGELYPVIVNASESPIIWRPTATDTAVSGVGAIEVRIQIGDVLGKSCTIEANVLGSLGAPGGTPAAPAPDWTRTVTEDADRAEAAAEKAEAASTHMPQISANKTWLVWDADAGEYVDTGVSAAGEKGDEGDPGKAPIIGSNGNWYEWDETAGAYTDTGKPSRGKDGATGATGATGEKGSDGKSAYAYAVDGGYTGTEAEFEAKLAAEMPDKLPNPNALTFTGAATGNYDGSEAVTVNIPTGGGGSVTVFANDVVVAEAVAEYKITGIDPTEYSFFSMQVDRDVGYTANLLLCFIRADGYRTNWFAIADHVKDSAFIVVRPIERIPWSIRMRYSNTLALLASSPNGAWYAGSGAPGITFKNQDNSEIAAGTKISIRGYKFENF